MRICYGINNSHEPNFFKSFIQYYSLKGYKQFITAHEYIEVVDLVKRMGTEYYVIGKHYGKSKLRKAIGLIINDFKYLIKTPKFDISISHGNSCSIHTAKLRGKISITFTDNDINATGHRVYFPFVNYLITPVAITINILVQRGANKKKIFQYNGYKEDIYIADYKPNPNFLKNLPFEEFVTVRAESIKALYVPKETKSIVPELLKLFEENNVNVLFFPRYQSDKEYAKGRSNVYIPDEPLNGLDACYYSKAVLTGAGTFAREAACLGTPAVSFFPGKKLLQVDQKMIQKQWMFHSRNPEKILNYVMDSKKRRINLERSKKVQKEVFSILDQILEKIKGKKV